MPDKADKQYQESANNNEAVSINDKDNINDSESIQEQDDRSNRGSQPTVNTNFTTQATVNNLLTPLKGTIENITKLLGLEPPKTAVEETEEGNKKVPARNRVDPANTQNKENKSTNNSNTNQSANNTTQDKKQSSSGGLNLSNINNAAKKFSDDPVTALKEKAQELGKQMGLKAGNEEGQGKISAQENEGKFNAFLSQSGTPNPLPKSDTTTPSNNVTPSSDATTITDNTSSPITDIGNATSTTNNPPATTPNTNTNNNSVTENNNTDKDKKEDTGPALSPEQAAEHFTAEFKLGYNQGFNDGYTEGANVTIAANSPEVRAAKLKETQAYKDGILAGQAEITAPGKETDDRIKAFEDKYCQPFKAAKAAQASNPNAPAPSKELEDNNLAYNQGFNDGYTKGGNEVFNAEAKKQEAEKENPEYIEGAKLSEDSVANPEKQKENEAKADKASTLFKRGYYQSFNDNYTKKANETIIKERNAFTDAGLKVGPYKEFYEKGIGLGHRGNLTPSDKEIEAEFKPSYETFEKEQSSGNNKDAFDSKKEKSNATAAFNIGIQKGYQEQQKAQKDAEKDKAKQSPLFQKAFAIGQVIGLLELRGGDNFLKTYSEPLTEFFKKQKFDIGNSGVSLESIKNFLIKESIAEPITKTIKKDNTEIPNPQYQDFNVGFNQGWDMGYKNDAIKSTSQEKSENTGSSINHIDNSPDYLQGYKDGKIVGKLSAETSNKVASDADKQAFEAEISKLNEEARAKGQDFYRGFSNGINDGYMAELAGLDMEEDPLDKKDSKSTNVINKYKELGDTDMVQRLEKLFTDTYKEIHEEIYNSLTKPLQAANNSDSSHSDSIDQFDTIPTEADLDKNEVQIFSAKLGARGELSDLYDDELMDIDNKITIINDKGDKANETDKANKIQYENTKKAIADEIHDYCRVYKGAYQQAAKSAKDKGYSYIKGYTEMMQQQNGSAINITIGKIENYSKKEYNNGKAAAESYGSAIRMNKMFDENPDSKYISDDAKPKMPKQVVSKAYKQGYEESFIKWSIIEYTILGIAIPDKFTNDPIYREFEEKATNKVAEDGTTVVSGKTKRNKSLYAIPKNINEANLINSKRESIKTDDIRLYNNKMLSGYYADMVSYINTYLLGLKDTGDIITTKVNNTVKEIEGMNTVISQENAKLDEIKTKLKPKIDDIAGNFSNNPKFKELVNKLYTLNNVQDFRSSFKELVTLSKSESSKLQTRMEKESEKSSAKEKSIKSEDIDIEEANPKDILSKIKTLEANTFLKEGHLLFQKDNPFTILINNVGTSEKEFAKGYSYAINKVDNSEELSESANEDMTKYLEKIGYTQGFVQKVASLGLEKDSKEKALKVIAEYLKFADFDFPQKSEIGLKKEYTDIKEFKITPSEILNDRLSKDAELKIQVNQLLKQGKTKGEAAAELSFNLSTKDFTYVNNTEFKKENASALAAGPLGQKAVLLFEAVLKEVNKLSAFIDIQKQLEILSKDLNSNNNANVESINKLKSFQNFTKMLFGKSLSSKDLELKNNTIFFNSKLEYEEELNAINTKNTFFDLANKVLIGPTNTSAIINIYSSSNKQLGLLGSGFALNARAKDSRIEGKPKFIIPSIEKGLIAKDNNNKDIKSKNEAEIKEQLFIKASSGKINLDNNSIKSALQSAQSKIIDILNKEEMANHEANKTSK